MKLDASDPRYHQAIAAMKAEFGLSIPDILLPTQWCVFLVDDTPQIVVNADGMRALALIAPRPDASEYVEELIAAIHDMERGA